MIKFILNDQDISTDQPPGSTVLDFVRYHKNLKGTKIGCREGDCGACTILVGELIGDDVEYRTMTSCLMPLANARGKHIVSIEGINPEKRGLTPVQQAMIDESGTQCGFCTVGFVMSLTGFCLDAVGIPDVSNGSVEAAISAIDGNICRCTGYKSIERAASVVSSQLSVVGCQNGSTAILDHAIRSNVVPSYFSEIKNRLANIENENNRQPTTDHRRLHFVGGGTDVYVQRPETMAESTSAHLFYDQALRGVRDTGTHIEIGASVTVTDLLISPVIQLIFPDLYKHLKLVSSTPIRNMATLAGNLVNASPIGDMTVWFLALDAEIRLSVQSELVDGTFSGGGRILRLHDLYLGYKQLAKSGDEYINAIRFRKPTGDFRFNFEKVCKRTYLDIATVNTAISLTVRSTPGKSWLPPALSRENSDLAVPPAVADGAADPRAVEYTITEAHVAAGGISPIPLYLKETSAFLIGKEVNAETLREANEIIQSEISPISDVRGTERYKRLLLRQLFTAHFVELFDFDLLRSDRAMHRD